MHLAIQGPACHACEEYVSRLTGNDHIAGIVVGATNLTQANAIAIGIKDGYEGVKATVFLQTFH